MVYLNCLKHLEIFSELLVMSVKLQFSVLRASLIFQKKKQRTSGPVNAHMISWPSKAQNLQNLENI